MSDTTLDPVEKLVESLDKPIGDLLLCRYCGTAITQTGEKMTVARSEQHRFTNPAGVTYSIACYHNAPGCDIHGAPTLEDSWFGGYFWQLATCNGCHDHLGWYYQNSKKQFFFGLIQARLIESPF
jgi:hypothetical protein